MKSAFFIYCALLSIGGISAVPAIAAESPMQTTRQMQVLTSPALQNVSQVISQTVRNNTNFEAELLKFTNIERQKVGLLPLRLSSKLSSAAQSHATDMANKNYFSHTGLNGSSMASRTKATGYKYSLLGENIAAGGTTAEGTVRQWMNSPGHRANILNNRFTEIGFGYANSSSSRYRHYWVQVFGTPQRQ